MSVLVSHRPSPSLILPTVSSARHVHNEEVPSHRRLSACLYSLLRPVAKRSRTEPEMDSTPSFKRQRSALQTVGLRRPDGVQHCMAITVLH